MTKNVGAGAFKEKLLTEIFPSRKEVPKTLFVAHSN